MALRGRHGVRNHGVWRWPRLLQIQRDSASAYFLNRATTGATVAERMEASLKALVIGGTGPSGHFIVNGLLRRGYQVAILHTGRHEVKEIPETVEHIHSDPFSENALTDTLGTQNFDLTIAAYGRLRRIAEIMAGRTGEFISIGGAPAYRGYMNAATLNPCGMPIPTAEDAPLV